MQLSLTFVMVAVEPHMYTFIYSTLHKYFRTVVSKVFLQEYVMYVKRTNTSPTLVPIASAGEAAGCDDPVEKVDPIVPVGRNTGARVGL